MRTAVAETSLATFHSLSPTDFLQPREQEIMVLFERDGYKALSRQQIAKRLGRELGGICGRCNSLVTKGQLVERGERTGESGKPQKLLCLPTSQRDLFA